VLEKAAHVLGCDRIEGSSRYFVSFGGTQTLFERPTVPAYRPRDNGDGDLNYLLSLPQLAMSLQGGIVVLFELFPQGSSRLDALAD
jgi:hypothetical protein